MRLFFIITMVWLLQSCTGITPPKENTTADFDPLISPIKEYIQQIDQASNLEYKTKSFTEGTTTGVYTGVFQNRQLVKIITEGQKTDGAKHWEFYLQNSQLVMAHIKESTRNCHGNKFCAWEIKNYFLNGHLFKSLKRGDAFLSEAEANVEEKSFNQNMDEDMLQQDTSQQQYAAFVASQFESHKK